MSYPKINIIGAIEEARRRFLKARRNGETFNLSGKGQSRLSSKRWK